MTMSLRAAHKSEIGAFDPAFWEWHEVVGPRPTLRVRDRRWGGHLDFIELVFHVRRARGRGQWRPTLYFFDRGGTFRGPYSDSIQQGIANVLRHASDSLVHYAEQAGAAHRSLYSSMPSVLEGP
jgi:hypothetical protein